MARHHWPKAGQLDKLQRLVDAFVWSGAFNLKALRAWMSRLTARSPVAAGGLNIPDLTHELQAMSVDVLQRWTSPCRGLSTTISQILQATSRSPSIHRTSIPTPTLQATLAATGQQVWRALTTTPREDQELPLVEKLLPAIGRGTHQDYEWVDHGVLRIDCRRVSTQLRELRTHQATLHGNLDLQALLQAKVEGSGILLNSQGHPVTAKDYKGVVQPGDRIGDVVEVSWHHTGKIQFRPKRLVWPLLPTAADSFRRFCDTVVLQYPDILRQRGQPQDLVLRPPVLDLWWLDPASTGYELMWNPAADLALSVGRVHSTQEATAVARAVLGDHSVHFETHDWLDRPSTLWRGTARPTTAAAKQLLARPGKLKCQQEATSRATRWQDEHEAIAAGLDSLTWTRILALPRSSAAQRLLLHRLKSHRLSRWDRLHERVDCPHCATGTKSGGALSHVFWTCPQAQHLCINLAEAWSHLWATRRSADSTGERVSERCSLKLLVVLDKLWSHRELARLGPPTDADTVATHLVIQAAWRQKCWPPCRSSGSGAI